MLPRIGGFTLCVCHCMSIYCMSLYVQLCHCMSFFSQDNESKSVCLAVGNRSKGERSEEDCEKIQDVSGCVGVSLSCTLIFQLMLTPLPGYCTSWSQQSLRHHLFSVLHQFLEEGLGLPLLPSLRDATVGSQGSQSNWTAIDPIIPLTEPCG